MNWNTLNEIKLVYQDYVHPIDSSLAGGNWENIKQNKTEWNETKLTTKLL